MKCESAFTEWLLMLVLLLYLFLLLLSSPSLVYGTIEQLVTKFPE